MKAARPTTIAEETLEFKAFWEIWRPIMHKNDGRGAARDEFFRHVEIRGANPQDIVDGARWYVRTGGNGEYKLHAQTWLNRRAYEDGCEQERAFQARLAETAAKRTAHPPKPIIQPEQAKEDREAIARRVYERLGMTAPSEVH